MRQTYEKEDKKMTEVKRCVFKKARCSLVGECHDLFFLVIRLEREKGKLLVNQGKTWGRKKGTPAACIAQKKLLDEREMNLE